MIDPAQLRAVFPWLEEIRQKFIARHGKRLKLPIRSYDGTEIDDLADLDWGQINFAMSGGATPKEMAWLEVMKRIRNAQAHRQTARYADLAAVRRCPHHVLGPETGITPLERA